MCVYACVWFAVLLTWGASENAEVRKRFRTSLSVLQFPYSTFHTLVSVLSVSVLCFRTFISALQCFAFTPTWDGSPGETAVSEYVIEDRQVFPWHLSRSYQRADYIE